MPPSTSLGQCDPVYTREYATISAGENASQPKRRKKIAASSATHAVFAEWFDGNERPADSVPRPSEISSCTGWKIPRHGGYASESWRTPNSLSCGRSRPTALLIP